ncbi:MAG: asparagine--tRNA ligase [Thermodesulfobacteriota bacterium]
MSIPWVYIGSIGNHTGQTVCIKGWLYNKRSSGKIHFLQLRDGTGFIQGVMVKKDVDEATFSAADKITQESSVTVFGIVREDQRAPSGYELALLSLEPLQTAVDYPITPKEHGTAFLMENRHLWLRSSRQRALHRLRNRVEKAIVDFFFENNFIRTDTPILTATAAEGTSNLFATQYYDLGAAYLAQTGQLYLEAAIFSHGLVYNFGPTFRAEKSKTRRHLSEFWMVEAEEAYYDNDDNIHLQERLVQYLIVRCLEGCREELKVLERDTVKLEEAVNAPFARTTYDEAVNLLQGLGNPIQSGDDLGGDEETALSLHFGKPVFIINYPKKIKAFYMKEDPQNPERVKCADLIASEGYGEIIGGSQREEDYDKLLERMREFDIPLEPYRWYVDLRKYGSVPHSGFGLGIERTVSWIAGISHVREAILFPRMLYRIYP